MRKPLPVAVWQIRDFRVDLREAITERARAEKVSVAELAGRHWDAIRAAGWEVGGTVDHSAPAVNPRRAPSTGALESLIKLGEIAAMLVDRGVPGAKGAAQEVARCVKDMAGTLRLAPPDRPRLALPAPASAELAAPGQAADIQRLNVSVGADPLLIGS